MDYIRVTTQEVRTASADVAEKADAYYNAYNSLYAWVEEFTSTDYRGEEADAFRERINGFKEDFNRMKSLMAEYATFLDGVARDFDQAESDSINEIRSLQN